jgi:hypothetical protein
MTKYKRQETKCKAMTAVAVLYGFKPWLLLQGKEIDYKHLKTSCSGKCVNLKHDENEGYYVTMDLTCSLNGRSKKYRVL